MKKYLRRLVYLYSDVKVNPLMYVFVYFTVVTGAGFISAGARRDPKGLTMYEIVVDSLGYSGAVIMGSTMVIAAVGVILSLMFRKKWALIIPFIGFSVWFYMGMLYLTHGYIEGLAGVSMPNVMFWSWYSYKVDWFYKTFGLTDTEEVARLEVTLGG